MADQVNNWNEEQVATDLIRLKENQPALRAYVDSVRKQFIDGQNLRIARARNKYVLERIESLKLANEYRDLEHELLSKDRLFANEQLRLDLENQKLRFEMKDEDQEKELRDLDTQRRKKEAERDIAQLDREIEDLKNPPQEPRPPSADEIKEKKRRDLKQKILDVEKLRQEVADDPTISEDQKQYQFNQFENKLFELRKQLLDLI